MTESSNRLRDGKGHYPDDVLAETFYWLDGQTRRTPEAMIVDALRRVRERGCACEPPPQLFISLPDAMCSFVHRPPCPLLQEREP